jgi:hypothetical protein
MVPGSGVEWSTSLWLCPASSLLVIFVAMLGQAIPAVLCRHKLCHTFCTMKCVAALCCSMP